MRRRGRSGFKDRFPRLPPGCTPSDVDRAMAGPKCPDCGNRGADGHAKGCPQRDDEPDHCHVCRPPPDDDPHVDDWVFCDSHDMDDLRAKMEQEDHENPPPERWSGDHDGAD